MVIGFTPLDPLVVVTATLFAAWLVLRAPIVLMGWLPLFLSVYVFIPTVTLLTLWQTVPMLIIGRICLMGRFALPPTARLLVTLCTLSFLGAALYAVLDGTDAERTALRGLFYLGTFSLFAFCYDIGRHEEGAERLAKGLAVTALVLAGYGLYQIVAVEAGLPLRGILRGTGPGTLAFEGEYLRVNSLANEPKRLGYVLFVGSLAWLDLARRARQSGHIANRKIRRRCLAAAAFTAALSLFTFSGSYFLSLAVFGSVLLILSGLRMRRILAQTLAAFTVLLAVALSLGTGRQLVDAVGAGLERRQAEIESGLDRGVVYRQEIYARDYLAHHPVQMLSGVGLGQYYGVLNAEYGPGAGKTRTGRLMPLNSTFFETLFDLGGLAAIALYAGLIALIVRTRRCGFAFFSAALLFLTIQSLTILTLPFTAMVAGTALGQIRSRSLVSSHHRNAPTAVVTASVGSTLRPIFR